MYTVIRFMVGEKQQDLGLLWPIGEEMNVVKPETFDGPRNAGDGFACSVARSSDLLEHNAQIMDFLSVFEAQIISAVDLGFNVSLDVAIDSEDYGKYYAGLHVTSELLKVLGRLNLTLDVTAYRPFEDDE